MNDELDLSDYYAWLRLRDLGWEDDNEKNRLHYSKSTRKGKHVDILNRRRRKEFGPGKYYGATSESVHRNKKFVKGWRGINPERP